MEKNWLSRCHVATRWEEGHTGGRGHPQTWRDWLQTPRTKVRTLSPHPPGSALVRREGEKWTGTPSKPLPFLLTAYLLRAAPTLPSASTAPFLLVSKPVASDSLTIPGSFPACISRRTTFATIAVVWKSFFSRTSPHRKNSWFRKIKFRYTKQGST